MRTGLTLGLLGVCAFATPGFAQHVSELASQSEFRVCADPHDLPFSNDKGEGFENKIAQLIASDLKVPVVYTYFPDSQGFVRATLQKFRCDVVIGTVAGVGDMATTQAYYHTGYMMVTRESDHITADRVGDPSLGGKRFGLVGGTPPTDLLVAHNLMDQTTLYNLVVDTRVEQPAHTMLTDLANKKIDVALSWGPIAGYYDKAEHLPVRAVFLNAQDGKVRLDYHIAMGVRPTDNEFRRTLNRAIAHNQAGITKILEEFGVPMLDEQGHPVDKSASAPG